MIISNYFRYEITHALGKGSYGHIIIITVLSKAQFRFSCTMEEEAPG